MVVKKYGSMINNLDGNVGFAALDKQASFISLDRQDSTLVVEDI